MIEAAEVVQMLFLSGNLEPDSEEIGFVFKLVHLFLAVDFILGKVLFDDIQDSSGVANKRSEDQYFTVRESSAFLFFQRAAQVPHRVIDDDSSELLNFLLLSVVDKDVIKIILNKHVGMSQRLIIELNLRF